MEPTQAGRYELRSLLGRGGGGAVYVGWDPMIGREVAVKLVPLGEIQGQDAMAWALREAQAAGVLSHPHIVMVHDIGAEKGYAYIVMELVRGTNLAALLNQDSSGAARVAGIIRQTAEGLDFAHTHGIFHRDVKPANILVREDGVAKIVDFGIARIQSAAKLTRTGQLFGTPQYMSPEQIQGKPADARSDQFSLAVVAYEALAGALPFAGDGLVFQILTADPPPVNPRLDAVFKRALAKKPEERYGSCAELAEALERALEGPPAPRSEPKRALAVSGAAALLALVGGGLFWLVKSPAPPPESPGSRPSEAIARPAAEPPAPPPAETPSRAPRLAPPAEREPRRSSAPAPAPVAAVKTQASAAPPASPPGSEAQGRIAIWSGVLAPGGELTLSAAGPSTGAVTVEFPPAFLVDRVSPRTAEVTEGPSAANGFARLRIRNRGSQPLDLVTIQFRPRPE